MRWRLQTSARDRSLPSPWSDVVPYSFGRIQVRCVAGQPFDRQPVTLFEQELLHALASMSGKMIPDEDDFLAAGETAKLPEKHHQAFRVVTVGLHA